MRKKPAPWAKWSPSRLDLLLFKCPLSFYFDYISGMRGQVKQNLPKVFGSAIHHMLETFFTLKNGYKSMDKLIKAWIYYWLEYTVREKYGTRLKIKEPDDIQKYLAAGIQILKRFYVENLPYRTGKFPMPKVEKRFDLIFKGHRINGVIDRIQPVENKKVEIWDYKTGYKKPSEQELLRNVQFTFYNWAIRKQSGQDPIKLRLHHLSSGEQFLIPIRTKDDYVQLGCWLDEATVYLRGIMEPEIKTWKYFPFFDWLNPEDIERKHFSPRPGSFCAYCDYDELCKKHKPKDELREWWIDQELKNIKSRPETIQFDLPFPKKKLSLTKTKSPR
jgi:RecB family exonuclease